MLVGMAITLVMMAAVVQLFANISQGVRNRRATMEVSAVLRTVRAQLYNDLAGATCLKYPKNAHGVMPKPDSNNMPDGYFEIVEGRRADEDPGPLPDPGTSLVPSSNSPLILDAEGNPLDPDIATDGGARGDFDDIIAMTVEHPTGRFRGRGRGLRPGGNPLDFGTAENNYTDGDWVDMAITSPIAEVVWFAVETPPRDDPRYRLEMGEPGMRRIYRRVLLVAPWYGTETRNIAGETITRTDPLLDLSLITNLNPDIQRQQRLERLRWFQETYDISVRLENDRLVPNSLADLARREHRFAHAPNSNTAPPNIAFFPHQFPYEVDASNIFEEPDDDDSSLRCLRGERQGEDLVLDNVLAFDVQVYDPGAPLYQYQGTIVPPSSSTAFTAAVATGATNITGFGAYVDLGWNNGTPGGGNPPVYAPDYVYNHPSILSVIPNPPMPLFQQERRLGWHPTLPN